MAKHDDAGGRSLNDLAKVAADDNVEVITLTRDELQALIDAGTIGQPNPAPAIEEGPHLKKADIREAKRQQLLDARASGDLDEDVMTDDMREILAEG
jgi:hypothetical protein